MGRKKNVEHYAWHLAAAKRTITKMNRLCALLDFVMTSDKLSKEDAWQMLAKLKYVIDNFDSFGSKNGIKANQRANHKPVQGLYNYVLTPELERLYLSYRASTHNKGNYLKIMEYK